MKIKHMWGVNRTEKKSPSLSFKSTHEPFNLCDFMFFNNLSEDPCGVEFYVYHGWVLVHGNMSVTISIKNYQAVKLGYKWLFISFRLDFLQFKDF